VIVISARDREEEKITALDAGADDYLEKPFGIGELLARLRVALRHRGASSGTDSTEIVLFPGLTIDSFRRLAHVDGRQLVLTPKEWELLQLFSSNAGRVLTHRQILKAVWGSANVNNIQYLRVYIGQLRQKLGAAGALISTETGVGYRMADCLRAN
jgi:two-component system KDP operon response regulator KdpE